MSAAEQLIDDGDPAHRRAATGRLESSGGNEPTVLRMLLGGRLRQLREACGVTQAQAGAVIRGSHAKISRLESGRSGFKRRDVADLLMLYGVRDEWERATLMELVERANAPRWWHSFADVVPAWFQDLLGLEASAAVIRNYEVQFIPGLLQTPDYARAIIGLGHQPGDAAEVERRVDLRMARQQLLDKPDPPTLWAVVDESALRRPIGGRRVLRAQLEHLAEACFRSKITIQIVPFDRGGHAVASGSFTLLRFSQPALPDIVYLEQLTSATYLDKRADVEHYWTVMNQLSVEALPAGETSGFLGRLISEL